MKKLTMLATAFLITAFVSVTQASIELGGISFVDNAFADEVISYTPGIIFERQITGPFDRVSTTPEDAVLGADLASSTIEMTSGQTLNVGFVDNAILNGVGDDLAIYELFSSVEYGEITINGITAPISGVSLGSIPIPGTTFNNDVNLATIDLSDFGLAEGVGIAAFQITVTGSGSEYAAFGAINSIPEPASLGLLSLICGGIYFSRRFFKA